MKTVTARDLKKNVKEWVGGLRQDRTPVTRQNKPPAVSVAIEGSDRSELMSTASPSAAARDLRLDFFRGLALFCIFIDHIPNNILAKFTLQSLMFADAAEVFILISGYTAGMVYGRIMERQGFVIAAVRIYHRVWQLYVAHIFLFMIFMATMAYTAGALNTSLYAEEFGAANFLNEPGRAARPAKNHACGWITRETRSASASTLAKRRNPKSPLLKNGHKSSPLAETGIGS